MLFLSILATCVLLFGNFAVVRAFMQPRTHLLAVVVASEIGSIHDAYLRLPPPQRLPWLHELVAHSRGGLTLAPQGPEALRTSSNSVQAETMETLQRQVPHVVVGLSTGHDPRVWFGLPGEGGDLLWLTIPVIHVADRTGTLMAVWGSGGVLVVLGGLLAVGWRQQRLVRGAGRALEQIEASSPQGSQAFAVATAAPPADLPDVRSLEELVRAMSIRMESVGARRDQALLAVARELRAVLKYAPAEAVRAQRLAAFERLTGQFEAFARPQAMEAEPVRQVDLNALVERMTLRAPVGVTLGLAPIPPLSLRPQAMECLLDNLLANALSHGGGQVVVTSAEEGDWVVLRVLDRGEPLADDELAMIGRPFYRTDSARAKGVTAGLGLAVARHVAQIHGGHLAVHRREGGGLAVEVRLPLPQEESAAERKQAARRKLRPAWVGMLGDMALLAVLYIGALALGLSLLFRTVMDPNTQASLSVLTNALGGLTAAYVTLPAEARPAYLRDLQRHSSEIVQPADPARSAFAEPLMPGVRAALQSLRQSLPGLEVATSPLPDAAFWVRMPPTADGADRPWLRMDARLYSKDLVVVALGLVLLVAASAAFVVLRARRRLDWAAQALREGQGDLQAMARARGENTALVEGLMTVRQRFAIACERLAQAKDEQELLLARLLHDLREGIEGLRQLGAQSPGLPTCADQLERGIKVLDALAQPADRSGQGMAHVNQLLAALPIDPAVAERHPIRWSLGGVPFADIGIDEARRVFGAILNFLLAQQQDLLEVASAYENGWVMVRFTERGGRTDPGAAAQALMLPCHMAESRGGFMRFGQAPDQGGAQVEILLPPARLS